MKNLSFVIWMIGWPITCAVSNFLVGKMYGYMPNNSAARGLSALVEFLVWVSVAMSLWVR